VRSEDHDDEEDADEVQDLESSKPASPFPF